MPTIYKVLGQSAPSAATLTTLYTVPAGSSAIISTIAFANRSSTNDQMRIAIRVAGSAISDEEYIVYDDTVQGNTYGQMTAGITLAATDVVSVYSTNGTISFNAFGSES
jgi:hypothetical protein